jgi:hypothetical protein
MCVEQIRERPAGAKFTQNQFHRDARALDARLAIIMAGSVEMRVWVIGFPI